MKIRLLAFASAGDALGGSEMEVEMPPGARVADLRSWLDSRYPKLLPLWPRLAVAVDGTIGGDDRELAEGAEVALLPPVSGGSPDTPPDVSPPARGELVEGPISGDEILRRVTGSGRGAVVLFLGTVRNVRRHGESRLVSHLTYSAYRPMASRALETIAADLEAGADDLRVAIVHRLGDVAVGEASVAIAVASPHRAAAYEASRVALERLKAEVPIWKRECYADGAAEWREEESLLPAR
jgi:molybdopterin synthase catalytic subunit